MEKSYPRNTKKGFKTNRFVILLFLACIYAFSINSSKAQVVCGPVNTLYQTVGNATTNKTEIYRYNNFQQTYIKVGQLPDGDSPTTKSSAPNSAYNATTQYIYSSEPSDGGKIVRVYDPANSYAYIGKITITGTTVNFNNTLLLTKI